MRLTAVTFLFFVLAMIYLAECRIKHDGEDHIRLARAVATTKKVAGTTKKGATTKKVPMTTKKATLTTKKGATIKTTVKSGALVKTTAKKTTVKGTTKKVTAKPTTKLATKKATTKPTTKPTTKGTTKKVLLPAEPREAVRPPPEFDEDYSVEFTDLSDFWSWYEPLQPQAPLLPTVKGTTKKVTAKPTTKLTTKKGTTKPTTNGSTKKVLPPAETREAVGPPPESYEDYSVEFTDISDFWSMDRTTLGVSTTTTPSTTAKLMTTTKQAAAFNFYNNRWMNDYWFNQIMRRQPPIYNRYFGYQYFNRYF